MSILGAAGADLFGLSVWNGRPIAMESFHTILSEAQSAPRDGGRIEPATAIGKSAESENAKAEETLVSDAKTKEATQVFATVAVGMFAVVCILYALIGPKADPSIHSRQLAQTGTPQAPTGTFSPAVALALANGVSNPNSGIITINVTGQPVPADAVQRMNALRVHNPPPGGHPLHNPARP
jgi:hypothetical protein